MDNEKKPFDHLAPDLIRVLENFHKLIADVTKFGIQIIEWDIAINQKKDITDEFKLLQKTVTDLPQLMGFRNILDILDAISILIKNGSGDPAKILFRSLLENIINVSYIMDADTIRRATAFIYCDKMNLIDDHLRFHPKTHKGKQTLSVFSRNGLLSDFNNWDTTDVDKTVENLREELKNPVYDQVRIEYDKRVKKRNERRKEKGIKSDPDESSLKWHSLFNGPVNIEQLSRKVNLDTFYHTFYKQWSGNVHATDIIRGKLHGTKIENQATIEQIRRPIDIQQVVLNSLTLIYKFILMYTDKRVQTKKEAVKEWLRNNAVDLDYLGSHDIIRYRKPNI